MKIARLTAALLMSMWSLPIGAADGPRSAQRATTTRQQPQPRPKPAAEAKPAATGAFVGTILFDGPAPARKLLYKKGSMSVRDAYCRQFNIYDESLQVDPKSKGIANVLIYLTRKPRGYQSRPPKNKLVFSVKNCQFVPHMLMVHTGQTVQIKNEDDCAVNVHPFPFSARNQPYNRLLRPRENDKIIYKGPERFPVKVSDDIHRWLSAYHLVLDHPFGAITDKQGRFQVSGLPAGDYTFHIWHERTGYLERAMKVKITAKKETRFTKKYEPTRFEVK